MCKVVILYFQDIKKNLCTHTNHTTLFQRRPDITDRDRALICYVVIYQNRRGLIQKLADKYNASRTFIYDLRDDYLANIERNNTPKLVKESDKEFCKKAALMLRMKRKCSIEVISSLMEWLGLSHSSVGFIRQTLTEIGEKICSFRIWIFEMN